MLRKRKKQSLPPRNGRKVWRTHLDIWRMDAWPTPHHTSQAPWSPFPTEDLQVQHHTIPVWHLATRASRAWGQGVGSPLPVNQNAWKHLFVWSFLTRFQTMGSHHHLQQLLTQHLFTQVWSSHSRLKLKCTGCHHLRQTEEGEDL